jgi:3-oxoacyl-[acyl-carrier protein] reductase
MKLKDKVVVVTGGVRDIGRAVSLKLAEQGAKLAINYYGSEEQAKSLQEELSKAGSHSIIIKGDMTSRADVDEMISRTVAEFGGEIHGLVNVVGGLVQRMTIDEMDEEFFDRIMKLNLNSTFLSVKATAPYMSKGSSIVNFASLAGRDGGGPGAFAYATSKGAVMTFTRAMAKELGPKGIRVNSLCPGMISTTFHDTFTNNQARENVANSTPLRREGTADEVSDAVCHLLSDDASFMTGVNLDINGGLAFS